MTIDELFESESKQRGHDYLGPKEFIYFMCFVVTETKELSESRSRQLGRILMKDEESSSFLVVLESVCCKIMEITRGKSRRATFFLEKKVRMSSNFPKQTKKIEKLHF